MKMKQTAGYSSLYSSLTIKNITILMNNMFFILSRHSKISTHNSGRVTLHLSYFSCKFAFLFSTTKSRLLKSPTDKLSTDTNIAENVIATGKQK